MSGCRAWGVTGLLLLLSTVAAAAESPALPRLELQWPSAGAGEAPAVYVVGRPIPLQAVLVLPPGYRADAARLVHEQAEFDLRPAGPPSGQALPGGGEERVMPLSLLPLQLGELTFEGLAVPWMAEDGSSGEAVAGPVVLTIQGSIEDPLNAEPADIRGPAALEEPSRLLWWLGALAGLLLAVGVFSWWRRRRRAAPPAEAPPVDPFDGLSPAAWALAALQALMDDEVYARHGSAVFHVRLAAIAKQYLHGQFRIVTLERTTSELLEDFQGHVSSTADSLARLRQILHGCDMVKFARHLPGADEAVALARTAERLVEETRPGEPPPAASRQPRQGEEP